MAGTTLPNLGLIYAWIFGENYKTDMDANLALLDRLVQVEVLSRTLTAPPGGEAAGDRYIPAATATGAWSTHEDEIAVWTGSTWVFIPPLPGWSVWDAAQGRRVVWDGTAWVYEEPVRVASASSSAGALTLDMANGNHFQVTLTENVTSITISNWPAGARKEPLTVEFTQDGTGGWTVAGWPAAVKWPGGTAPTISAGIGAVDVLEGFSLDAGTTIRLARTMAASA